MDIKKMKALFQSHDVPDWIYAIDELGGGEIPGIAKDSEGWYTYYSERGKRRSIVRHASENDACLALIDSVKKYPNVNFK